MARRGRREETTADERSCNYKWQFWWAWTNKWIRCGFYEWVNEGVHDIIIISIIWSKGCLELWAQLMCEISTDRVMSALPRIYCPHHARQWAQTASHMIDGLMRRRRRRRRTRTAIHFTHSGVPSQTHTMMYNNIIGYLIESACLPALLYQKKCCSPIFAEFQVQIKDQEVELKERKWRTL